MLDPKLLRNNPEAVKNSLKKRGAETKAVDDFLSVDEEWRKLTFATEELRSKQKLASDQVPLLKKKGENADKLLAEMKQLSDQIKENIAKLTEVEEKLNSIVLLIPNIVSQSVPEGKNSEDNLEIRKWGTARKFEFKPLSHEEIGTKLGIFDFEAAVKVSGGGFVVDKGLAAQLERSLMNLMLDLHTKEHKFTEVFPPILVNSASMRGTGQLPKFADDLYKIEGEHLWLVPTAEVSITNILRDKILEKTDLPIYYTAYSPCFRKEAGSYGQDVKGIIRQHQFNKVELVKFVEPERSAEELESLTKAAEKVLQLLELPYRVVALCSGDLGFSSAKTYDIEVWFPSQNRYREISSCSNFEDFQARRANIKYRPEKGAKPEYVHTLNGSGLAIGRCLAAILENYQKADGTIEIPKALRPYLDKST
jgi:seryl-tRNA synthetase